MLLSIGIKLLPSQCFVLVATAPALNSLLQISNSLMFKEICIACKDDCYVWRQTDLDIITVKKPLILLNLPLLLNMTWFCLFGFHIWDTNVLNIVLLANASVNE